MQMKDENLIYMKAVKSFESLSESIRIFESLLKDEHGFNQPDFYKARTRLREGESYFDEALINAKKLMGPLPEYTDSEYEEWRKELLKKNNVLVESMPLDNMRSELQEDEFLKKYLKPEEINKYLEANYQAQQIGKRKLSNIKVRIILEKLEDLIKHARELNRKALQRQRQYI